MSVWVRIAFVCTMLPYAAWGGEPHPAVAGSGEELFQEFCATCHGRGAHGDGPMATSLRRRVPDLTLLAAREGGVFPDELVHQMIDGRRMPRAHGTSDMPVWGWEFYRFEGEDATRRHRVAELIDQLVAYLRSIQRAPARTS